MESTLPSGPPVAGKTALAAGACWTERCMLSNAGMLE